MTWEDESKEGNGEVDVSNGAGAAGKVPDVSPDDLSSILRREWKKRISVS